MENNSMKKTLIAGLGITALSLAIGNISLAQKPKQIDVSINDEEIKLETNAKTVKDVLNDIGYNFVEGSKINYNLDEKLVDDMDIEIDTQKSIKLLKGGKLLEVKTFASTVKELLEQESIKLSEDDIVSPSLDTEIEAGDKVTVDFYTKENYTKEKTIKFASKNQWSFDLEKGQKKVTQEGKDGVLTLNFTKTMKNGKLISDEKVSEEVTVEPVTKITSFGSKKIKEKKIKFDTIKRENSSMYKGEKEVVQEGKNGLLRKIYEYNNDGKKLVKEEIIEKPVDKIIEVGSKAKPVKKKKEKKEKKVVKKAVKKQAPKKVVKKSAPKRVVKKTVRKTAPKKTERKTTSRRTTSTRSSAKYSLSDLRFQGIIYWNGYKYTYYSQKVLPGGGLNIPGRHINAGGFVADSNGYIVLANDRPKGTVLPTPFGYKGKVYDRGTYGNHIDVYTK